MRKYQTPIGELWSVTTVLNCVPKPWLGAWIKKEARIAVLELLQEKPDVINWDVESQEEAIKEAINSHERKSQTALDMGSLCHNCLEVYFKEWDGSWSDYVMFLSGFFDANLCQMLIGAFTKLEEEGIKVIHSEETVYHSEGFAGTMDCLVELQDGSIAVLDFKTSLNSAKASTTAYQLEAYRRAWNELCKGKEATHRVSFGIDKENPGECKVIYLDPATNEEHWNVFKSCLTIWKAENPVKIKKERKKK